MKKWSCLVALMLLVFSSMGQASSTLWYNGDMDGLNGLANESDSLVSDARVYDDFIVPSGGWTVDSVWSNDLTDLTFSSASWEIRSGVSAGNGGTLLFSGTSAATQTATGRIGFGYSEYTMQVNGLNIPLDPGTYWLTVEPIGGGSGRSFNSTTSGLNAVGNPPGNDNNSFFDSTYFAANFVPASLEIQPGHDFSMGVGGASNQDVPEPGTLTLALFGLGAFGLLRRRSRKSK